MSTMAYQPPASQLLSRNPQLPTVPDVPDGSPTDSEYAAQEAILRAQIMRAHADVLRQLGFQDDSGAYIPGEVAIGAQRQQSELERSQQLATEDVTHNMQNLGTLFSGRRATEEARATHPFVQAMADLAVDVPKQLSQLYEQGSDLTNEYVRQRNLLLIDAAKRRAAALAAAPGEAIPPLTAGTGGTDTTTTLPPPVATTTTDTMGSTAAAPDSPFFLPDVRTGAGMGGVGRF